MFPNEPPILANDAKSTPAKSAGNVETQVYDDIKPPVAVLSVAPKRFIS